MVPLNSAVSDEMSALAVPDPTNPGGLSTAGTVWYVPPSTETANEIGWLAAEKSTNEPETDEQSALTISPVCALAVPAHAKNEVRMTVTTARTA